MYTDIGEKIQILAKWIFTVETIGAIVTGIILLADEYILAGLLTLFCGPIFAWISTWILYAFGQLVEDIHDINDQTSKVYNISQNVQILAQPMIDAKAKQAKKEEDEKAKREAQEKTKKASETKENAPYWCGKCGHDGPYDENCPMCGSTIKRFNVNPLFF